MTKGQKAAAILGLFGIAAAAFIYLAKHAYGAPANGFTIKLKDAPAGATQWMFDLGAISFDPAIRPYLPQHTLGVSEMFTFDTGVPAGALMHLFVGSDTIILVEGFNMPVENKKTYVFDCATSTLLDTTPVTN